MVSVQQPEGKVPSEIVYSEEERRRIVGYLMDLSADQIREFLSGQHLPKTGTKPEIRERILGWLEDGVLQFRDIVLFLDSVAPWGKQHVFLYDGPEAEVVKWRNKDYVEAVEKEHGLSRLMRAQLPLILPVELSLSVIVYTLGVALKITAVERREDWQRATEYDEALERDGREIVLKAYVHEVSRGLVMFSWDLVSNEAILQITQLPSGTDYGKVRSRFSSLIKPWLNLDSFTELDLRRAIRRLHEMEELGTGEVRSHAIGYRTPGGRLLSAQSPTPNDSVLGEKVLDSALVGIRTQGVGHLGNFYWLSSSKYPTAGNTLRDDVHTVIVANRGRINFTTPQAREEVEYVLSRVRAISR